MNVKSLYSLSVVVLIALIFVTIHSIYVVAVEPSPVVRNVLVELDRESIVHTIIENEGSRDIEYTIQIVDGGKVVTNQPVLVRGGKSFSYMRHVYPEGGKKEVNVLIYRGDKAEPVDNTTYYIGFMN
jgi:hypothetical protein